MEQDISMTERVYNFSAGPAVLPLPVLEQAQRELTALPGVGASVLEISHRGQGFVEIHRQAKETLGQLLGVPDDHEILFLQGGARLQFAMIPMNLMTDSCKTADYVLTGTWGNKAWDEADRVGEARVAFDAKETNYDRLPDASQLDLNPDAAYVHITSNETIQGVQFPTEPDVGDVPLVCDSSSDILCRPIDVSRYGLIYACAQKNAGPAGVTLVIIRKDLLERSNDRLCTYLNYSIHAKKDSLYNTPPSFGIYMVGLVAKWLADDIGGLEKIHQINRKKSKMLYDLIDQSHGFYEGHAMRECRSLMNVAFRLPSDELTKTFIEQAEPRGLTALKGHRSVGGIRASIYNAMPVEGVEKLCDFMREFRDEHAG